MKFSEESYGAVKVFHLEGKIMGGPESQVMCDHLKNLVTSGSRSLVMDFDKVQWINSNGIGIIIACLTGLRRSGGDLRFAGVHDATSRYFEITKLNTVIKAFVTVEEAVASFSAA